MPEIIQPLNLEHFLVNTFAGSAEVFVFLAIVFTSVLAARFRMPSVVYGTILVLLSIVLQAYMGGLYVLMLAILGFAVFSSLSRIFDR